MIEQKATYGKVLEAVHFTPSVYQSFLQQIQSQIEYECANDHDWNKADDDWSGDKYPKGCSSQHHTSNSTVPSTSHKKH